MGNWLPYLIGSFAGTIVAGIFLLLFTRPIVIWIVGRFTKRLMSDP